MERSSAATVLLIALAFTAGRLLAAPPEDLRAAIEAAAEDPAAAENALERLDRWIKKNDGDAEGYLLRSTAHFMAGRNAEGRRDLDRALALDPGLRQAWLNRGAVDLAEGDYAKALAAFERAEEIAPDAADNSLNIGTVLLLGQDLAGATAHFARYLETNPRSAEAYYTVASNYGMAGHVAHAKQALEYAIRLDEKSRRRARVDPNFGEVARDPGFRQLLETDAYRPPRGSLTAAREYDFSYSPRGSRLLQAVIRSLELAGEPFDGQIEAAEDWALIWAARFRVKVVKLELTKSRVELTAPPGSHTAADWKRHSDGLFNAIRLELLKIVRSGPAPQRPGRR